MLVEFRFPWPDHVLSCPKEGGGLPSLCHNEIRDLQGARLDVAMNGFWGSSSERCFIDVRVFKPLAPSNSSSTLSSTFKKHEDIKQRAYGQRIREVEHASFTPVVMPATGGWLMKPQFSINDSLSFCQL